MGLSYNVITTKGTKAQKKMISLRGRKEENIMANIIINEKKRTIEMSKKDYTSACNTISRLKYR